MEVVRCSGNDLVMSGVLLGDRRYAGLHTAVSALLLACRRWSLCGEQQVVVQGGAQVRVRFVGGLAQLEFL